MKTVLYTITIALLALGIQSCSFKSVKGNGNVTENTVNISDYNELRFSGSSTIVYEQEVDQPPYLRIEIDENLFPLLSITSESGILSIEDKENIKPTQYKIYTNSKSLTFIGISGSAKIHLKDKIETTDLNITVSGVGKITGDSIMANSIKTKISGSADIALTGKTNRFEGTVSGSGKVKAMELYADTVTCTVSGSGNFDVYAEKILNVKISGAGKVNYKGDATINQSISGAGKVSKID